MLEPFEWCQVTYLYTRELYKTNTSEDSSERLNQSLSEANELSNLMRDSYSVMAPAPNDAPLGYQGDIVFGYHDLIHWPSMVCAANIYASLSPGERKLVINSIKNGVPPIYANTAFTSRGCEQSVMEDPEYRPAPPCLPSKGVQGFWYAIGAFVGTFGILTILGKIKRKRS